MNRWTDDGSWAVVCFDLIGFISFLFVCSSVPLCSSLFVCLSVRLSVRLYLYTGGSGHFDILSLFNFNLSEIYSLSITVDRPGYRSEIR